MTKEINGIEYIVYEAGMNLNQPDKSFYFEDDLDYDGDVNCLHFYAVKKSIVRGNQYVRGNQDVGGNQYVGGYQDVGGYQYVGGYQDVGGNQYVGGYQDVGGYQYVGGYQDVGGYQYVGGYQDVGGYQYVRYLIVYLFCKWTIRIDRDSDNIKIGCVEKSISQWESFFKNKETINLSSDDRNYKKIEQAFNVAKTMRLLLISMNDKKSES